MFKAQIADAIMGAPTHAALDALGRAIWQGVSVGAIGEGEASSLAEMIQARRVTWRASSRPALTLGRGPSLFDRARLQQPPERAKAIERRRRLAASGPMPPQLACKFTTGELAALRIVADEVRDRGSCRRTYAEIAARAGIGRTTAQNAMRRAARLGLLTIEERRRPGHKSLPNVVRIVSREWSLWIDRKADRPIGLKKTNTTDKGSSSKAAASGPGRQKPDAWSRRQRPEVACGTRGEAGAWSRTAGA